jgi:phosphoglycolate phosphatase-like HAD superfamily hydrolase
MENITLGLLTGNIEEGARIKLAPHDLNKYFSFGAFGSDAIERSELPAIAMQRANEPTGKIFCGCDVVIIGDSVHDVECGKGIGAKSIAVATGGTSPEELLLRKPNYFFEDLSESERVIAAIWA